MSGIIIMMRSKVRAPAPGIQLLTMTNISINAFFSHMIVCTITVLAVLYLSMCDKQGA